MCFECKSRIDKDSAFTIKVESSLKGKVSGVSTFCSYTCTAKFYFKKVNKCDATPMDAITV